MFEPRSVGFPVKAFHVDVQFHFVAIGVEQIE